MSELVSVYIPTHNRSEMLKRAVNSVLLQSYKNIEIIISDDGSSDDTQRVAEELVANNNNVHYVKSDIPMGACHARNAAINIASGVYITGLDDDDEFTENRINDLLRVSKDKKECSFISSGILKVEKKGVAHNYIRPRVITYEMIKNSNCVGNQIFTKTEFLRGIGGFDEELKAWQDYDCWLRMIKNYGDGYNCALFNYIMHTEHENGRITKSAKVSSAVDLFLKKHRADLSNKNIKNINFNFNLYYVKKNNLLSLLKNITSQNIGLYSRYLIGNAFYFLKNTMFSRGINNG